MQSKLNLVKSKILQPEELKIKIEDWKSKKNKIVFTNGCFDIMHRGHVEYLCNAASMGNILLIGVNDDQSVKRLEKGKNRPVNDLYSRMLMLASLTFVDAVTSFSQDTPESLIKLSKPDVLVKGGDYEEQETDKNSKKYIVGSDIIKAYGGIVKTIPFVPGFSTTNIINRLSQ